jgi:hypothetical protein
MPSAALVERLAAALNSEIAAEPDAEILGRLQQPGSLIDIAIETAGLTEDDVAFLEGMPNTLLEGVRAIVVQALGNNKAVHVQFSPAYEFGLHVWDYGQGVSVHLAGPYPDGFDRPNFGGESKFGA